jgi:hypothetical protein
MVIKTLLEEDNKKNISKISNPIDVVFALTSLMCSAIRSNEKDTRKNLFREAVEVARQIESSYDRSHAISSIGEWVVKLGDVDFGKNLFQEAVEVAHGIEDSTYRRSAISSIEEIAKKFKIDLTVSA